MAFFEFGGVQIFRPSHEMEAAIRDRAVKHICSRFAPGEYRGAAGNAVVQQQFKFYDELLRPLIPKLAGSDAVEFLLFQYDEAARILHGQGMLDLTERELWSQIEGDFKRGIKYLVELLCMSASEKRPIGSRKEAESLMECALICAESMTHLAHDSEVVYGVFPNDCIVRVFDSGPLAFELKVRGTHEGYDRTFSDRVIRDRRARDKFVGFPQFDVHTAEHQRYLDDAFAQSFGMSYGEFIAALRAVIQDCQPSLHPRAFPVLFVHRGRVIDELTRSGRPREGIERALDGFTVTAENLTEEGRQVWKPKQENRAYRRGFYLFHHETGPHLAFSRAMAQENLMQLVNWICYQRVPREWDTPLTRKAAVDLSAAAGKWFEGVVTRNLQSLGIEGQRIHRTLGKPGQQICVPASVGELDFLGFHRDQRILVLVEAKMVMTGLEGRYWRDDLDQFVLRAGSYAERFRRKMDWVSERRRDIAVALGVSEVSGVGAAMLTLYPCIASEFIVDFPCVSLTEFMLDHERAKHWPYSIK